jgi:hypothetical protein
MDGDGDVVNLEPFKFARLNRASVEPRLYICDAWWLLFLTLLVCISCHMHHNYYITIMYSCMQIESVVSSKCVIGI